MRRLISQILEASGESHVVATARNGVDALQKVHALDPELVTMDVDMPELDGLQALGYIMSESPRPGVMLSAAATPRPFVCLRAAPTQSGHDATLRALELGAVDFVRKPSGPISLDLERVSERLLSALRAALEANPAGLRMLPPAPTSVAPTSAPANATGATRVVAIACSTGGPRALA